LRHKYVKDFSAPESEIACDHTISIPMNENKKYTIKEYREALYENISRQKKISREKWKTKYLE
jgi:mitogen-activated protein kinase 15